MLEQDYIMRLIKETLRMLLKLLFHIELTDPITELLKETEEKQTLQKLMRMVDEGNINEAENEIYDMIADKNREQLKTALLFYAYLNEKTNDFLEKHHFSREEIKQGVENLVTCYGLESFIDTFLN